jgi:cysteine-rich repeat protein
MIALRRESLAVALLACACGPGLLGDGLGLGDDATSGFADDDASATRNDEDDDEGEDEGEDGFPPGEVGEVGEVDGDEFDDEAGDEVDSGTMSVCGDGFVDEGEPCDDGNDIDGDGCDADCTPTSGLLLWSQTFDGAGEDDIARDIAMQGEDIVVVGAMEIMNGDDVWTHVFTSDGGLVMDAVLDLGSDERGTSVAATSSGATYVVGTQPQDDRALLMLLDGNGLVELGGAPTEITSFTALATPTGEGFAMITNAGGFENPTATLSRFDYAANPTGVAQQPEGIFVYTALPDGVGGTILGGGSFSFETMESAVWLAQVAVDGTPGWNSSNADSGGANVRLRSIAMSGDGRIVGVGSRGFGMGGGPDDDDQGWIWWWSADGVLEDDGPLDVGGAAVRPNAVVVGANGLIVGGTALALDDGFVAGLTYDGALQWGQEIAGDLGLEDGILALELAPGLGVVAAGWVTQSGTGEDAWVGVFTE